MNGDLGMSGSTDINPMLIQPLTKLKRASTGVYVADKGFAGDQVHRFWYELFDAQVVSPPHQRGKVRWSKDWRRWPTGLHQIIETTYDKLLNTFRLARERPHTLDGFQARLAAKLASPLGPCPASYQGPRPASPQRMDWIAQQCRSQPFSNCWAMLISRPRRSTHESLRMTLLG